MKSPPPGHTIIVQLQSSPNQHKTIVMLVVKCVNDWIENDQYMWALSLISS